MKVGLVGSTNEMRSLPFDAQRTINLIPTIDESGAEVASLTGAPGLSLFSTIGTSAMRGIIGAANDRVFAVSGAALYEIASDGTATSRGSLSSSSGMVSMADNGLQLAICDGDKVYILTYATNAFTQVTDADLPSAAYISFVDGYFIVTKNNSGQFYISALYNGLSWGALDFATAESSPDNLSAAVPFVGNLGLFGHDTIEIWRNTGDSTFPFSRISGATPVGTLAPKTIVSIDTSVYWVGHAKEGGGIVYQAQGFNPKRISTEAIEKILQSVTSTDLVAWAYQQEGHSYLIITGSTLETSLVYDIATGLWHERAYLNSDGTLGQHLGNCCTYGFGYHLVGSRVDGKIYKLSLDVYSDNGNPIPRKRIFTHIVDELKPVRYNTLTVGFETGVGLQSGQGSDPTMSLRISRDGAKTWSNYYTATLGAVGKYKTLVDFRRLGIQTRCTFEISVTDPVKIAITGAYLNP